MLAPVIVFSNLSFAPAAPPPQRPKPIPREIPEKRTATSKTFDNGDGSFTLESAFGPIHYQDSAGAWQPIDTTLEPTVTAAGPAWKNRAAAFSLTLPEQLGSKGWVSLENGSARIAWRPVRGIEPSQALALDAFASVSPTTPRDVRYTRAFEGADLDYTSTAAGLKESIVLSRYTGQDTFSFELLAPSLTPSVTAMGTLEFRSADSTAPAFVFAKPHMWDSAVTSSNAPAESYDVSWRLSKRAIGWRVDLVAEDAWLSDPARVFPVTIDPTALAISGFTTVVGDAYVKDTSPSTNYGYDYINGHSRLEVGYSPSHGTNVTLMRPDVDAFLSQAAANDWHVTDAKLQLFCYYRYQGGSGTSPVDVKRFDDSWSEMGVTWNSANSTIFQPGHLTDLSDRQYVHESEFATWQVGPAIQHWVEDVPAQGEAGLELSCPGNSGNTEVEFESWEHGDEHSPTLSIRYTMPPQVKLLTPTSDVPVSGEPKARFSYFHRFEMGDGTTLATPQNTVEVQVRDEFSSELSTTSVETTGHVVALPSPPSGSYQDGGRYLVRLRAAGVDASGAVLAWSLWTPWAAFTYESNPSSVRSGSNLEPYRSAIPVAGGLAVDLETGELHGSRTDFTGPGLGSALSFGPVYDSDGSTESGLGPGWKVPGAKARVDDQALEASVAHMDAMTSAPETYWASATSNSSVSATTSAMVASSTGSLAVKVTSGSGLATLTSYGVGVDKFDNRPDLVRVWPGERVRAGVWAKSSTNATVTPKLEFYDGDGQIYARAAAEDVKLASTSGWQWVSVATDTPSGAYGVRLAVATKSGAGTVWLDESELHDGTLSVTDGDGTLRSLRPAESGSFARDPLAPALAFARADRSSGASVTARLSGTPTSTANGASLDGVMTGISANSTVDRVAVSATGANYLEYTLDQTRCLSGLDLYLQQRVSASAGPVNYSYKVAAVEDGNIVSLVSTTSGSGWVSNRFTPRAVRKLRVYGISASSGTELRVAELELPVLTMSDSFVSFDPASGRLDAVADEAENLTRYAYDGEGRLQSVADSVGRSLSASWSGSELDSLSYTGVSSTGTVQSFSQVVRYRTVGDTRSVETSLSGRTVKVASYHHDPATGRIDRVTDADGVSVSITWNGARVASFASSPTVTSITYSTGVADVTVSGEATASVTSQIEFDPDLGAQVTRTEAARGSSLDLSSTVSLDEYGHAQSSTDPEGHVDSATVDAHGNVWISEESGIRSATREFEHDRVYRTLDAKGNVSTYSYDSAWRPLVSSYAVADDSHEGMRARKETYDQWGNRTTGDVGGSTSVNLVDNPQFEIDPFSGSGGWSWNPSSSAQARWDDIAPESSYRGKKEMFLLGTNGAEHGFTRVDSSQFDVVSGQAYSVSSWAYGVGSIWMREVDKNGAYLRMTKVFELGRSAPSNNPYRRFSARYVPGANCAKASVLLYTTNDSFDGLHIDDVRVERSNVGGDDDVLDNSGFERVSPSTLVPNRWWKRSTGTATMKAVPSSLAGSSCVEVTGQWKSDGTGSGYFNSDLLPVSAGETYAAGGFIKTKSVIATPGMGAYIELAFYAANKSTSTGKVWASPALTGTVDWERFSNTVVAPPNTAYVQMLVRSSYANGSAWFDSVFISPASGHAEYEYDPATHTYLISATDTRGHVSQTDFDALGRAVATRYKATSTAATSNEIATKYDELGRVTSVTVAPGTLDITAGYQYSDAGRLTSVTNPLGRVSHIGYDSAGRPTTSTSPGGWNSRVGYDALGRATEVYRPTLGTETPSALVSRSLFDEAGRPVGSDAFDEAGSLALSSRTTLDRDSKPLSVTLSGQSTASAEFSYDSLDRPISAAETNVAGSFSTSTTLDLSDLATRIGYSGFGTQWKTDNTFAKTGEWVSTAPSGGASFNFAYGSGGSLVSGMSSISRFDRSFDQEGRLTFVSASAVDASTFASQSAVGEWDIAYDGRERISRITQSSWGLDQIDDSLGYDAADRLTSWTRGGSETTYAWDKAGNLISKSIGGATTTFEADADDRITRMTAGSSVTTFTHDAFGRMTGRSGAATATYGWDARSELATVVSGESTVTFAYDISGLPARRVETTAGGTGATEYFWSTGQLAAERFSDGSVYRFSYRPDGAPLGLVTLDASGTTGRYAYQLDPLGNVAGVTDATGTVVAEYVYDPHGAVSSVVGTNDDPVIRERNPLRYRGYFYDEALSLYILPARVYDPSITRFLSVDPVEHKVGQALSGNGYAYCEGNPVAFVDPDGRDILLGNYYDTPDDDHEPDIPQQDAQPGGGIGPQKKSVADLGSQLTSGQRERRALEVAKAMQKQRAFERRTIWNGGNFWFTQPQPGDFVFDYIGAALDVTGWPGAGFDFLALGYYVMGRLGHTKTNGDIVWQAASMVPGVSVFHAAYNTIGYVGAMGTGHPEWWFYVPPN